MFHPTKFSHRLALWVSAAITALLTGLVPIAPSRAAPLAQPTVTTVELSATDDIGVIESVPTAYNPGFPYFLLSKRAGGAYDYNFMLFDLSVLPPDAVIEAAQLQLNFSIANGVPLDVELGRAEGDWSETSTPSMNWNNKPAVTWGGLATTLTVTGTGTMRWPVKTLVADWQSGARPNYGLVARGVNSNGGAVEANTKDASGIPPKLIITYSTPPDVENAHPDLGDAPDSTNHHGVNNTAYTLGSVLGQFPTVWNVPAGQVAGPRHANQTGEGFLGQFISREIEADQGPDQDGPNNILRNAAGVIGDVADRDRGDDGWRNRNIQFFSCQRQTLTVRVSKAPAATLKKMYLNVWFDGNRDGDWGDMTACQPPDGGPAQAGYEWIVQDYVVDMTVIPAGGFLDFNVNTERVLNTTEGLPHWMRFTLSEDRAVQPGGGALPDGRGPHPTSAQGSYQFGETEDIFQKPAPAGENGVLELHKRVIANSQPTEWIDYVTYEILLHNNGGSQPVQAGIRDLLPYPLIVYPTVDSGGIHYVNVESPDGGATPLQAQLEVIPPQGSTPPQQVVKWLGSLAPNATVKLTFHVRVIALCEPNQQTMTFTNQAQARPQGGAVITADASFTAKCIDYNANRLSFEAKPAPDQLDPADLRNVPVQYTITNSHAISVNLGFFQLPNNGVKASTTDAPAARFLGRVTLAPQQVQTVDLTLRMESEFSDELALPPDYAPNARIAFCILLGDDNQCPDAQKYPQLNGELPLLPIKVRPNDLGDAPDSTNHAGVAMAAYPAVQANFPTVFDPALGLPQGPRHSYPRPFHLGQRVSREAEADLGPDQDPLNNIIPAANDPDNDRFDDGTNFAQWNLNNCQTTNLPVQVAIGPAAVNYFQQLGAPGYVTSGSTAIVTVTGRMRSSATGSPPWNISSSTSR
ncbi:MAG: DNRLRE domain-containing protein [Caldilineaceae bacterium]